MHAAGCPVSRPAYSQRCYLVWTRGPDGLEELADVWGSARKALKHLGVTGDRLGELADELTKGEGFVDLGIDDEEVATLVVRRGIRIG